MEKNMTSKPGDAPIMRIGHTQGPAFGTNPQLKAKGDAATPASDVVFGGGK